MREYIPLDEKDAEVVDKTAFSRRPTFAIVCGLLGLVAFIQVVMVGVALASRVGETRVVEVTEAGEVKVVYIPTIADALPEVEKQQPRSYDAILKAYGNTKDGTGGADYQLTPDKKIPKRRNPGVGIRPEQSSDLGRFMAIKNSRVEKLVEEAKSLHLSGDVVRAVLKLAEAEIIDADEPAIIYRRALIFEDMRNWERAADEYEKLLALGIEVGAYYEIATDKITNGVKNAPDVVPFQLGNVVQRVSEDQLAARVVIPVRRITDREIEPSQIDVRIFFYDIVDNKEVEPVPQQREQNIHKRWVTEPTDWAGKTEESAEAVYQLPALELADVHLFGERRYFGHVVELYYKGELMDQYAYPGRLHGIHAKNQYKQHIDPEMMPFGVLPDLEGLDDEGMLLPTLKE
jgi:tetratricopeptide (TPR) repeat protein